MIAFGKRNTMLHASPCMYNVEEIFLQDFLKIEVDVSEFLEEC